MGWFDIKFQSEPEPENLRDRMLSKVSSSPFLKVCILSFQNGPAERFLTFTSNGARPARFQQSKKRRSDHAFAQLYQLGWSHCWSRPLAISITAAKDIKVNCKSKRFHRRLLIDSNWKRKRDWPFFQLICSLLSIVYYIGNSSFLYVNLLYSKYKMMNGLVCRGGSIRPRLSAGFS